MNSQTTAPANRARESDSVDVLHTVLADEQRRRVLRYVRELDGSTSLDALAAHLDGGRQENARKRTAHRLHHATLPKLADAGFVEYDAGSRTVRFRDCPHWEGLADDRADREDAA